MSYDQQPPELKYQIQTFLDQMPKNEYKKAIHDLAEMLGVSVRQLYRYMKCPLNGSNGHSVMNTDQLQTVADFFGVNPGDILNHKPALS